MSTSRPSYAVCTLLSLPLLPASDIPDSKIQFLLAVSYSMGAHMESFRQRDEDSSSSNNNSEEDAETEAPTATTESASADAAAADDCCEVCLVAPREGYALVPCGHARFCETCALRVADLSSGCPVCRTDITMVMYIFSNMKLQTYR